MTDLLPGSEEELAAMIREAASAGRELRVQGGGTRGAGASWATRLSTANLRGISLYEPGSLTLVAAAGTPLAEIEAALAAEGQMLPFEPWDARALTGADGTPTFGGMAATNASGPRRIQAGACRDSMIGVRFVDGTGMAVKNGGRVMKNVTGLDLVKLLAGSRGSLGVITEVGVKVLPRPERVATLVLPGLGPEQAVSAMSVALGTPFQVSAAAHRPDLGETWVRLEGFEGSVAHRSRALAAELVIFGAVAAADRDWGEVRDALPLAGRPGAVWRVSVKPSDGPRVAAALPGRDWFMDWGGGLVWVLAPDDLDLRAALAGIPGHATLVRAGAAPWPALHPEPAAVAALSAGLRARFDPHGILNPGRTPERTGAPAAA